MSGSQMPVRRKEAPLVPVDYRFDMSRRSVTGFATAAIAVAMLVFLSGLVIGVRLNLEVPVTDEPSAAATGMTEAPAAEPGAAADSAGVRAAGASQKPNTSNADVEAVVAAPATDSAFALQVGAFRSVENAEALRATLAASGYETRLTTTPGTDGELSRVVIGVYATEAEAELGAIRFRDDTGREVYVMTATEVGL